MMGSEPSRLSNMVIAEHWFLTLQEAHLLIEAWRREYNEERTHGPIGDVTPMEFIHHYQNQTQVARANFTSHGGINGGRSRHSLEMQ